MLKLKVSEITRSFNGLLEMELKQGESRDHLWFQLPQGSNPSGDLIAGAIAAIFGSKFNEIEFLYPISRMCHAQLQKATGAIWNAPLIDASPSKYGGGIALSFSGGFDSLAALALLGDRARLVSVDFGERFSRERDFFNQFDTETVSTNARSFSSSWTFMGLGAILLKDYLEADILSFGTIMEASPWNFVRRDFAPTVSPIFAAVGYRGLNPVAGFTEFGTAMLAGLAFPELLSESLVSLADPHTEKYRRKTELLKLLARKQPALGLDVAVPEPTSSTPTDLGKSLAIDFLAPGMYRQISEEDFDRWVKAPAAFKQAVEGLDTSFYWKDLSVPNRGVPTNVNAMIAAKKSEFDIWPYLPKDVDSLRSVLGMLSGKFEFPGKLW